MFLVDRSLGRRIVPGRVRALGYECQTLADFYGSEQAAQDALDDQWLTDAADSGLIILTRDGQLYINEHERRLVEEHRHRIFWIGPKKGPGDAWADRFEEFHERIVEYAEKNAGPYVEKVHHDGLQRAWP